METDNNFEYWFIKNNKNETIFIGHGHIDHVNINVFNDNYIHLPKLVRGWQLFYIFANL